MLLLLYSFIFTQFPICRVVPLRVAPYHSSIGDANHTLSPQPKIADHASGCSCTQGVNEYVMTIVCTCAYELIAECMVRGYFYVRHPVLNIG
jgi:hypothetical protein